jgi:hypothetical protein
MLTEDKKRFDLFHAGLTSMGLSIQVEASSITSWLLLAKNTPVARIFYEPDKPFHERFTFQSVRSRQES